ncbi:tRNA (adenosine(37)-N6)-threonylcarbamoyltransferase complex ATPase subunit type 1 TsaE [Leucobacter sp. M11]|uniref:tRNA (adenosine(37)-N6)-threonylcarbamoyltransferase complex ATPase subunit type 1 TsaE n=1 Tax=Leucobacter sp. M11 TaxID=2993565 RepID=UPI003FA56EB8
MAPESSHATLVLSDPEAMHDYGVRLGRELRAGDLLVLTGPLGAGKTTLSRGIGEGLGIRGPVTSPTFVVARTHPSLVGGPPLIHVDAYRLADADELDDLDLDFARSVVIAEWGEGLIEQGAESWLHLVIERPMGGGAPASPGDAPDAAGEHPADPDASDDAPVEPRTLRVSGHGPRWQNGVPQ